MANGGVIELHSPEHFTVSPNESLPSLSIILNGMISFGVRLNSHGYELTGFGWRVPTLAELLIAEIWISSRSWL